MQPFDIIDLGLCDYDVAYNKQLELLSLRIENKINDTLVLVEHPPVFTIGRQGSRANILVDQEVLVNQNIAVLDVERGGDITYHGPGQQIIYPIFKLEQKQRNIKKLIRAFEIAIAKTCQEFGANAVSIEGFTGVWIDENANGISHLARWQQQKKISSIGLAFNKWCCFHGISLNINLDLTPFNYINLCGLAGKKATSIAQVTNKNITPTNVKPVLISHFSEMWASYKNET